MNEFSGLIIPGGESTTISKLAKSFGLFDLIANRIKDGMPTYGSCAGMIMVAKSIKDPASGQETFGGIDMVVERNAFGRQVDSFEEDLEFKGISGPKFHSVFIRAPWVALLGKGVEVLAEIDGHAVAVRPLIKTAPRAVLFPGLPRPCTAHSCSKCVINQPVEP